MEERAGLPSKRELISQLIDSRQREEKAKNEIKKLKAENERLKGRLKFEGHREMGLQLRHARKMLAEKKQRGMLSEEEWQLIREFRGQC